MSMDIDTQQYVDYQILKESTYYDKKFWYEIRLRKFICHACSISRTAASSLAILSFHSLNVCLKKKFSYECVLFFITGLICTNYEFFFMEQNKRFLGAEEVTFRREQYKRWIMRPENVRCYTFRNFSIMSLHTFLLRTQAGIVKFIFWINVLFLEDV